MGPKLQFAFLGPHNSYLASVTFKDVKSGCPNDSVENRHHGFPKHWIDKYLATARNRYISNIRGNDIFALIGHVAVCNQKPMYIEKSRNMIVELKALTALLDKAKTTQSMKKSSSWISKKTNNNNDDDDKNDKPLLLSLGPAPGSFFADLSSLNRYRWANLPPDLEDLIQEEVCRSGYGTIYDVAINAAGGWVVQFQEGKTYKYNKEIPKKLKDALSIGQKQRLQIQNLSLNHQNATDYLLLFINGPAHVSLHHSFYPEIKELIEATFKPTLFTSSKVPHIEFDTTNNCTCVALKQNQINAEYYNKRGLFHLRRGSPMHALNYMREAYRLNVKNAKYRDDYFMARVEAERKEREEQRRRGEQSQPQDHREPELFVERIPDRLIAVENEGEFLRNKPQHVETLQNRLEVMKAEAERLELPSEWSYVEEMKELPQPSAVDGGAGENSGELDGWQRLYELDSRQVGVREYYCPVKETVKE